MQEFIIPKIRLRRNYVQKEIQKFILTKERGIGHNKCGKLIIANNLSEEKVLSKIKKCKKNGILLKYINKEALNSIEPNLNCYSALYSKTSGIIDSHELMVNFISDIENKKGQIIFKSEVDSIYVDKEKIKFSINKTNFFPQKF